MLLLYRFAIATHVITFLAEYIAPPFVNLNNGQGNLFLLA